MCAVIIEGDGHGALAGQRWYDAPAQCRRGWVQQQQRFLQKQLEEKLPLGWK